VKKTLSSNTRLSSKTLSPCPSSFLLSSSTSSSSLPLLLGSDSDSTGLEEEVRAFRDCIEKCIAASEVPRLLDAAEQSQEPGMLVPAPELDTCELSPIAAVDQAKGGTRHQHEVPDASLVQQATSSDNLKFDDYASEDSEKATCSDADEGVQHEDLEAYREGMRLVVHEARVALTSAKGMASDEGSGGKAVAKLLDILDMATFGEASPAILRMAQPLRVVKPLQSTGEATSSEADPILPHEEDLESHKEVTALVVCEDPTVSAVFPKTLQHLDTVESLLKQISREPCSIFDETTNVRFKNYNLRVPSIS